MREKTKTDSLFAAQLDSYEELLNKVLHSQSDCIRLACRILHPLHSVDGHRSQLIEFNDRQLENWFLVEQDLLNAIFHTIKKLDPAEGFTSESGKETAHRFIDHWGHRAGKAMEAHSEFYSLIFPWNDGEDETVESQQDGTQEKKNEGPKEDLTAAA